VAFFKRLFRQSVKPAAPAQTLAMVLLPEGSRLDADAIVGRLAERSPSTPLQSVESKEQAMTASFAGGLIGLVHVPAPVPDVDLTGPTALAWHWPDANTMVAGHKSHIVCFAASPTLTVVDLHLFHTQLIASIVESTNAIGVYVGDGLLVRRASDYVDEANGAGPQTLPVMLWVGFNVVREGSEHAVYTTGLARFGLLELETSVAPLPVETLLDRVAGIAAYELSAGTQIGDGHTIGGTPEERFRVRHGVSTYIPDTPAALISFAMPVA
jgi:hypothetical protein